MNIYGYKKRIAEIKPVLKILAQDLQKQGYAGKLARKRYNRLKRRKERYAEKIQELRKQRAEVKKK